MLRKVTGAMVYLGISGELGKEVDKCYPALVYHQKQHVLTHNHCRINDAKKHRLPGEAIREGK